ncbi:MAG TPA: carboxypeptidase regulatory-like domain-containing protein [Pyrinomonadaceae bacterium]|nr:carboxypeptidase regulatory-like domain-containing protein [Pyrinomonadaceae bacterium]
MTSSPEVCPCVLRPHSKSDIGNSTSPRLFCLRLPDLTGPSLLRLVIGILLFLLIVSADSPVTKAQSPTATLTGTVTDPNEAVVPGVNIAVINIAQGFQRTTVTDSEGSFVVAVLPAGHYTVKAEREGFTTVEHHDVILNVNDRVALKIQLKVGSISSQTVDVIDAPALIDESATVGTTVDRRFVENMPLNGRSFQSLITLTPGIVLVPSAINGNSGQFSVNGQRANTNYFTVDGVSANTGNGGGSVPGQATSGTLPALTTFGGTNSLVSVDAMQEFQVQTSTYSAEYGRSPGGQISIITRSGTNDYHGSLFEYLRNDKLDANDWFANRAGQPRPPERQNDFGGTLGGPVVLPRFGEGGSQPWYNGKNRTFFFFSYEGLRLRTPKFGLTNVPSVNLRQTAAPGIQPILRAFPLPNGRVLANGFAEFSSGYTDANTLNATSIRIDQNFSNRVTLFGRYNFAPSRSAVRNGQSNLGTLSITELRPQILTVGATMILSPTISNELRANYSVNPAHIFFEQDNFGGTVPLPREFVLLPQYAPEGTHWNGAVTFALAGLSSAFFPQVPLNDTAVTQRQLNIIDTLTTTAGAHQLKFGVDYRRLAPVLSPRAYLVNLSGFTPAAVVSGIVPSVTVGAGLETRPIYHEFSAFAHDSWKLSPRLTVSFGLRWDVNPPPGEANGNDPPALTGDLTNLASLDVAPKGSPLWATTYNNFAPRFGVAYRLFDSPGRETVLRGGFGVFYDTGNGQGSAGFDRAPFVPVRTVANVALPLPPSQVAPPPFTFTSPYQLFITFDPDLKQPYTLQWNVAAEQSLGSNQTLTMSYVGNAGRRLLVQRTLTLTPFNPKFTQIRLVTNDSTSDYHSLQMQFQRRLSRGLQALASYTWAHAIDVVSSDVVSNVLLRGDSDYDIRHNLTGAVTYDIPRATKNAVAGAVLRDWSIDTRFNAQTALPLNIISGTITDPTDGTQIGRRVNLIEGVPVYLGDPTVPGGRLINRNAFSTPPGTQQGTLGRNVIRALPAWQIDLALRRQFNLSERVKLQFRAEAFNIFNHPNFGTINTNLTSTTFGQATNMLGTQLSGLTSLFQIGGPRSIQFGLITRF